MITTNPPTTPAPAAQDPKIERRVATSMVALFVRQVLGYGMMFGGNVVLARWLAPDVYGLFAAALAFQATLVVFSDVGLGPALIQRVEEPTKQELAALFTLQLGLFSSVSAITWMLAPFIVDWINLTSESVWVIRAIAVVFCVQSIRSIPAVMLERNLNFDAIAKAEVIGTMVYQIVLLTLVWQGFGLWSIIWGLAARYSIDLAVILRFYPWRPRLSRDVRAILPYVRFGLNMQGVRVMAYFKDQLPALLLIPLLGATSAGMWGWAMAYAAIPVYFNRLVDRVMFPAFSRVQHDQKKLGTLATTAIWLDSAIGIPILCVLTLFGPYLVPLIYTTKWLEALPVVYVLAINMVGGFALGTFFALLYATGRAHLGFRWFAAWVAINAVLAFIGGWLWQLTGVAIGFSLSTHIICVLMWLHMRRLVPFRLKQIVFGPLLGGIVALLVGTLALRAGWWWPVAAGTSLGAYTLTVLVLNARFLRNLIQQH